MVAGTVDDMRPYLRRATMAAAPITYGAGIQNKVLEAMACATPVIASQKAISALRVKNGKEFLLADEPQEFANKVIQLLDEKEPRIKLGKAGRRYVERNHDWTTAAIQLVQMYSQVITDGER